jgi:hypothetical protein
MLALSSPRLKAFNKDIYHALGIDDTILKKSKRIIAGALEKGQLTRLHLRDTLWKANIHADELRLGWLLMDAELDGLICSGSMEGRQFTYALLDERAPMVDRREKDELVMELVRRYFFSRGPATISDLAGWSGLRPSDIRIGMELNRQWLTSEVIDGQVYWFDAAGGFADATGEPARGSSSLFLLPALDEWAVAYAGNSFFKPILIIDGQVSGTWAPVVGKDTMAVDVITPVRMDGVLQAAVWREAERYSAFLGKKLKA